VAVATPMPAVLGTNMATARRFWITRLGYGFMLGVAIATLDFAHYFPLTAAPDYIGFRSFASMLLEWCGEGILLALAVGLAERWMSPRELGAWQLVLAVVVGAVVAVVTWQAFTLIVLRDGLGIRLFRDYLGTPVIWVGGVFYHCWLMMFSAALPRQCTRRGAGVRACWPHCVRQSLAAQRHSNASRKQGSLRCRLAWSRTFCSTH
jgi:hypothetical protein